MKRCIAILLIFGLLIGLVGCGSKETDAMRAELEEKLAELETENTKLLEARLAELESENAKLTATEEMGEQTTEKNSDVNGNQEQKEVIEKTSSSTEKVLDAFINNEIPLSGEKALYFKDMIQEEGTELGERIDLDNDGENELIITNIYGGYYLDVRDDKVWIFAQGLGTAGIIHYIEYDGAIWIYYSDTSHVGRQTYEFEKYEGGDNLVDSFCLNHEYWDDVNHVYTYRGQEISKEEYERVYGEIFGAENTETTNEKSDIESDIQNIREIYNSIQETLNSYEVYSPRSLVTSYLDEKGHYRKFVAQKGAYREGEQYIMREAKALPCYSAEYFYYYNNHDIPQLVFVFVYEGDEEYRYYLKDGKCIRYIDANGTVTDYPDGAESGTIAYTDCFIETGNWEIDWANEEMQE